MIPFFEISVWGFFSFFLWFPRWLFAWYHLLLVPQAFPLQIGPRFQGRGLLGTDSFFVYLFLFLIPKLQSETVNKTVNKKKKLVIRLLRVSEKQRCCGFQQIMLCTHCHRSRQNVYLSTKKYCNYASGQARFRNWQITCISWTILIHHCIQNLKLYPVFWQTGRFIDLVHQLACWLIDELHWR